MRSALSGGACSPDGAHSASSVVESRYGETGWEHREPDFEVLKEVVDSKYTVFDVLPLFFVHQIPGCSSLLWKSTFAVPTVPTLSRRSSTTSRPSRAVPSSCPGTSSFARLASLNSACFHPLSPRPPGYPRCRERNPFKRISSISDMSYLVNDPDKEPVRKGVIVPVQYLDEAEEYLSEALEVFPLGGSDKKQSSTV